MTEKLDPKSAEDILKKYDKESDTMMYKGVMAKIVSAIAITFSIFQLYTATFGVLDAQLQRAVHLGFGLALVYLLYPTRKSWSRYKVHPFDVLLSILGAAAPAYIVFEYQHLVLRSGTVSGVDLAVGLLGLWLVIAATRLRAAGKTLDETADWLEENRLRVHQMGVLEDLFFCKRMGRVSGAAAVMGTLVGIRPLADINEKGLSDVIGKTRGLAPALKATVDYMARTVERPEEQIMLLSHSDRPERAEELRAMVEERFHPKELHVVPVCQSCGASIGPGLYAIFYFGRPISSGLTEERSLIAELTGKTK